MISKNKSACVTGAGSGIGRAIALRLAREGVGVTVLDRDKHGGEETVRLIEKEGGRGLFVQADVTRRSDIEWALAEAESTFGIVDVLVNNAGILRVSPAIETSDSTFDEVIAVNLRSVFICSTLVAKKLIEAQQPGRIINISSIHAVVSEPNACAYTAAKGGIEALSRTFASEWAPHGITVNCVRPGATRTALSEPLYTPEVVASLMLRIPLRAIAEPEDIAAGVAFLASADARYCTGTTLDIDGGYIMDGSLPGLAYQ
jgi:NAD(P)-dependent dehydrogenase (short-subunit alcohol dehydrogenase family)